MSGEVQPRRRRDKKKKRAQLEALAREEGWEEGSALYGVEHEEDEVVEPIRDSSSGEEEEVMEDPSSNQSMIYKVIFFLLLILLGAVASLVLVDASNSDSKGSVSTLDTPISVSEAEDVDLPLTSPQNYEHEQEEHDGDDVEHESHDDGDEAEEVDSEPGFFESLSVLLNELMEGNSGNSVSTPQLEETEESMSPAVGDPDIVEDSVEEEIGTINEQTIKLEDLENEKNLEATQIPELEPETQIRDPVDPIQGHTDPSGEENPDQTELKESTVPDPILFNNVEPELKQEESSSTDPVKPGPEIDEFEYAETQKSDGSVLEEEPFADTLL